MGQNLKTAKNHLHSTGHAQKNMEDILGMCRRWLGREKHRVNWLFKTSIFLWGGPKHPIFGPIIEGTRGYLEEQKLALRVHFLALKMENARRNIWKTSADQEKGGKIEQLRGQSSKDGPIEQVNFQM